MLEFLIAAALGAAPANYTAEECPVAFERREETRLILRLRPSCAIGYRSTRGAVRALPAGAPVPPDSKLPYDAILSVTLRAPRQ
jgi:hypothetical protein